MAALSVRATDDSIARLAADARCARGISWIERNGGWLTEQQIRLTEIPAPELRESRRAEAIKVLFNACGLKTSIDSAGNVIAERPGSDKHGVVLFAAHMDTVFPEGTDVRVAREGRRLVGPGISDNGAGLGGSSKPIATGYPRSSPSMGRPPTTSRPRPSRRGALKSEFPGRAAIAGRISARPIPSPRSRAVSCGFPRCAFQPIRAVRIISASSKAAAP